MDSEFLGLRSLSVSLAFWPATPGHVNQAHVHLRAHVDAHARSLRLARRFLPLDRHTREELIVRRRVGRGRSGRAWAVATRFTSVGDQVPLVAIPIVQAAALALDSNPSCFHRNILHKRNGINGVKQSPAARTILAMLGSVKTTFLRPKPVLPCWARRITAWRAGSSPALP
jgi:hypothetical protein